MPIFWTKDQTGLPRSFKIDGLSPSPTEQARIDQIMSGTQTAEPKPEASSDPGILGMVGRGVAQSWNDAQAFADSQGRMLAEKSGLGSFAGYSADEWQQAREAQLAERDTYDEGAPQGDFFDQSLYDKTRTMAGVFGNSAGAMAAGLAAYSMLPEAALAVAIGGAAMIPQSVGQNVEQQEKVKGSDNIDWGKAWLAGGFQALTEAFTDRFTLGVAGLTGKTVPKIIKEAVSAATKDGFKAAAKHVGTTAAVGAFNGALEEATQQAAQRWQADQGLTSPEAMHEYVTNAVVGAILEGAAGGVEGAIGANVHAQNYRATKDAEAEAALERDNLARRNVVQKEPPPPPDPEFLALEDHSGESYEQLALKKDTAGLPENAVDATPNVNVSRETFAEPEYRQAIEKFRDDPKVSADKIKAGLKIGRTKAQAIFDEMRKRNDANPVGPEGQWNRITVPKGIATRTDSDKSGVTGTEREYAVAPVDDTKRTPYTIHIGDRQLGDAFQTQEAAQKWAIDQKIKKFEIRNDTKGQQFAVYEKQYAPDDTGERRLVGNKVVNTFATAKEANDHAQTLDPNFSPQSNEAAASLAQQKDALALKAQIDKPLQQFVDEVLGAGRAKVDTTNRIDPAYLKAQGLRPDQIPGPDTAIEGVTLPQTQKMPQIISAAKQLADPNNQAPDLKAIVGGHELVHAIRNSDLLSKGEWGKLLDFGARNKVPGKTYTWAQKELARHPNDPFSPEEMIAEMFRHYVKDPLAFDKANRPLMQRIKDFIKKFLGLSRDDGSDLMKAIYGGKIAARPEGYGGLGQRSRDAFFSSIKVDPFYSVAAKFFNDTKQEKASAEQWMGMIRNSSIKPDELAWLDLEAWMKAWDKPIPRSEIQKYIAASSLQVHENLSVTGENNWSDDDEDERSDAFMRMHTLMGPLIDRYKNDVNMDFYLQEAEKRDRVNEMGEEYKSWFDLMVEAYAKEFRDPDAMEFLAAQEKSVALENKKKQATRRPQWETYTQEGGKDYGTIALYLPDDALSPQWEGNNHYDIPNVLASARFKTRTIDGKKTLFIEEVQSDLHQSISRYGSHKTWDFASGRVRELAEEIRKINEQRTEHNEKEFALQDAIRQESWTPDNKYLEDLIKQREANTRARIVLDKKKIELTQIKNEYAVRARIPDAPLKSSWEDFVIKRMIRYAAENDFDYLAWHGEADSVAETEQYNDYEAKTRNEVPPEHLAARIGSVMKLRRAKEKAHEAGDTKALMQMNDLLDRAETEGRDRTMSGPDVKATISPEVMDKYFPPTPAGIDHMVPSLGDDKPMNAIFNRYLEKMPRIAKSIGKKYGAVPFLYDPKAANEAKKAAEKQANPQFIQHFDSIYDLGSLMANYREMMSADLYHKLATLSQYLHQRGLEDNYTPSILKEAQEHVGIDNDELDAFMAGAGLTPFQDGEQDDYDRLVNGGGRLKPIDEHGNVAYKRWMMPLTDDLRKVALEQGFPLFSSVNKNDAGFAEGTKINMPPIIAGGDDLDGKVTEPEMPTAKFSAVATNGSFRKMVDREIAKSGYTPVLKQKLAKARIYDTGMTPYGRPLERGKPSYVDDYVLRMRPTGEQTPIFGSMENPNNNKREAVVIRAGGDWIPDERGISWPSGYGFNHSVWHHPEIAKDLGIPNDRKEMLMLFAKSIAAGGQPEMTRDNRAVLTINRPEWRRPLKIALGRTMVQDKFFKTKTPVWDFITAFTVYNSDAQFSGVRLEDNEAQYAATAPIGLRVPPVAPQETLRQVEQNMTYNNLVPSVNKLFKFLPGVTKAKIEKNVESSFIALQDRMLSVGDLIDKMKKNNGFITNDTDTYLREQLMAGQIDSNLQDNHKNFYTPLAHAVAAIKPTATQIKEARELNPSARIIMDNYGDKSKAISELYLYAQHARERNAVMRERNERLQAERPDQYAAGSGMDDEEADYILDWVNRQNFARQLSDLSNPNSVRSRFRKLITNTNDVRVAGELNPDFRTMTDADGNPLDTYQDYAPIRNWVEEYIDPDADTTEFARAGKGLRIMGKEDFSALGRRSLGADLVGHAVLQNEEALVRAGKNEVSRSFINLIRANPQLMQDVAEIIPGRKKMKYVLDRRTGRVRRAVDSSVKDDPSILVAKEDGYETLVKIKDPRIAKALNQRTTLGNNGVGAMMKGLLAINRYLAAVRTSYNPEFMISNFLRDLETAGLNISEVEMKGLRREILKGLLPALQGVREGVRNETATTPWGKAFHAFKKRGGQTAYFGIRELGDTIARMNKEVAKDNSGGALNKSKDAVRSIGRFIEDYNTIIENGVRVSTFKALRDRFVTDENDPNNVRKGEERAAFIAKNLTVNFNMGGDLKPMMNALYLFFNAGMQGSMALINPLVRSRRVKKLWGGVLAAGIMQDLLMSMLSPEDDDGIKEYDKIPDYILSHNLVMMDPFGLSERGYFKIPIPYLMNAIYNSGRVMSASIRGHYSPGEAFNSIGGTFIDAINPWSGSNSFLNFVAPTIADPIVDLARNEDFTGKPISPEANPYGGDEKASQRYWNNTSPAYIKIADWISRLTGSKGDYLPGAAEYSPNQIGYIFEWLAGGAGATARRIWDFTLPSTLGGEGTGYELVSGGDWSANDVPGLRRFYGNISSREDLQYYIKNRDQVLAVRQELHAAQKDGDHQHYLDIMQAYPEAYRIAARVNAVENARKKLSRQINKIKDSTRIDDTRKEALISALSQRREDLIGRANSLFREM